MTDKKTKHFKAETRQILDILIHSLYTDREIFLRELISNASDALTRLEFEQLTNRDVLNPDAELGIWITTDEASRTISIRDTGIGMNADELVENLGTIAHSGARAFIASAPSLNKEGDEDVTPPPDNGGLAGDSPAGSESPSASAAKIADIIGQFGVGFYSVFMVAESVHVISRSFRPQDVGASWMCTGGDTFTIEPADVEARGTTVIVHLKDDAAEYARPHRLREIIRKHSDFIPFPIYLEKLTPAKTSEKPGEEVVIDASPEFEQANRRIALWRQPPHQTKKEDYDEFYRQLTLDFEAPLAYTHLAADAPVQVFSVLYLPSTSERGILSLRRDEGLKLYARKVLIQDYCKDLLPDYLEFIQGVVDSEDLPLNVSRESVQSNRVMLALKKLVTNKALDMLNKLAKDEPEKYSRFWTEFGRYIKRGIASEPPPYAAEGPTIGYDALPALLRFHTTTQLDNWTSLDEYISRMPEGQTDIYYLLGDDEHSLRFSPHLDAVRSHGYEVLLMADPFDSFMLMRLKEYKSAGQASGLPLTNVARSDLKLPAKASPDASSEDASAEKHPEQPALPTEEWVPLIDRFKAVLGERVQDVRMTDRLSGSPARLVDPDGSMGQEMQRVYKYLRNYSAHTGSSEFTKEDEQANPKKILELNPRHPILLRLAQIDGSDERSALVVEQLYENALLIEGLHQDPASMIGRIHALIEKALQ